MKLLNRRNLAIVIVAVFTLVFAFEINAEDWTRFRGSTGNGVSSKAAPVEWSPEEKYQMENRIAWRGSFLPNCRRRQSIRYLLFGLWVGSKKAGQNRRLETSCRLCQSEVWKNSVGPKD